MKKRLAYIFGLLTLAISLGSCEKDYGPDTLGPLEDSIADIPVTVTNQQFFERVLQLVLPHLAAERAHLVLRFKFQRGKVIFAKSRGSIPVSKG